jgi:type IV pilus assembly protein PilW
MKIAHKIPTRSPRDAALPSGFSLVELMVAMAIGLVLLAVVGSIFMSTKSTFASSDQRGRVHEASRLVHDVVGSMVRQAGFVDIANTPAGTNFPIIFDDIARPPYGVDTGIVPVFACANGTINYTVPWSCTANPAVAGQLPTDAIVLSYQSQPANAAVAGSGLVPFAGGVGGDCNGNNPLAAAAANAGEMPGPSPVAINEFYVGRGVTTTLGGQSVQIPELYCRGNGARAAPQPMAQGVEQMRAFFHVGTGIGVNRVMRRLDAASVGNEWNNVDAVDLCVVMQSPSRVSLNGLVGGAPYTDCDGVARNSPDNRLRKANWFTFNLRNRTSTPSVLVF